MNKNKRKAIIDDGMNPELVKGADFDGYLGIPIIKKPDKFIIPSDIVPFTKREHANDPTVAIGFYEMDQEFAEVLISPQDYIPEFCKQPFITPESIKPLISPDCSLYRDAPLSVQITNVYRNRAIGYYYQSHGAYVVPQIRWGNELTYTTKVLPEKVAFLGAEKHSIIAIGTYGCSKTRDFCRHTCISMLADAHVDQTIIKKIVGHSGAMTLTEKVYTHMDCIFRPNGKLIPLETG